MLDAAAAEKMLVAAEEADVAARATTAELCGALAAVAGQLLPVGTVIDLRVRRGLPEYLHSVKTTSGNDRGTFVFQVAAAPRVDIKIPHFELASWSCEAFPISEKTGKPMSGATHGANSRSTVMIRGHFLNVHLSEDPVAARKRFIGMLTSSAVAARDAAPSRKAKP